MPDILRVVLREPLLSGDSQILNLKYTVQIPSSKFTKYGYTPDEEFDPEYWYIAPAVHTDRWQTYSNKDLQDIFLPPCEYAIDLDLPTVYAVTSILKQRTLKKNAKRRKLHLSGSKGLASQQYISAEGGVKSILDTRFANQWLTTINAEASIWNWIFAYGDAGYIKNSGSSPQFVWDSGIKLSLVADYFELYFPVASTNGFEMGQNNYGEKIRFKVTLSPKTLLGLFTRRWY